MQRFAIIAVSSLVLTMIVLPSQATTEESVELGLTMRAQTEFLTRIVTGTPQSILKNILVNATTTKKQVIAALRTVRKLKRGLASMRMKGEIRHKRTKKSETVQAIADWLEGVKRAQEQADTMEADLKEMLEKQTQISYEELKKGLEDLQNTVKSLADTGRDLAAGR